MPSSQGWKFLKRGQCWDCSDADCMLFAPVIEDAVPLETHDSVNGVHLPHFEPVCKGCYQKYDLAELCKRHRLPLRLGEKICRLCVSYVSPPNPSWS